MSIRVYSGTTLTAPSSLALAASPFLSFFYRFIVRRYTSFPVSNSLSSKSLFAISVVLLLEINSYTYDVEISEIHTVQPKLAVSQSVEKQADYLHSSTNVDM